MSKNKTRNELEAEEDKRFFKSLLLKKKCYVGNETSVHNELFQVDRQGFVKTYTDGACRGNGRDDAKAGIGIWFGLGHILNVSECLNTDIKPTNNNAEIEAVVRAISIVKEYNVSRIAIFTDSKFLINAINKWVYKWLRNGWKTVNRKEVKNKEGFRRLLTIMEGIDVKLVHVKAHGNCRGNLNADKLARRAALCY